MEITFIGHACFKIKGKNATLVIDPYDPEKLGIKRANLSADILLMSHNHDDHNYEMGVSDYTLKIDTPGEYETQDIFVVGLESFHDDKKGEERGKNTLFLIELDGFTLMHLGDLGHELTKETLEKISGVDVLMIPVGGVYTIDAKTAAKVISSLEPGIVVPMHYQTENLNLPNKLAPLEKFLDEMGIDENIKRVDTLKLNKKLEVPEETETIIIKPQNS